MITLDERRKSALIIQKLNSKKVTKGKKKNEKKEIRIRNISASQGEKNLFREAKEIIKKNNEETIKEQEKLKSSLVKLQFKFLTNYNFISKRKNFKKITGIPFQKLQLFGKSKRNLLMIQ